MNHSVLAIKNRIAVLEKRSKPSTAIIAKLKRKLRRLENANE